MKPFYKLTPFLFASLLFSCGGGNPNEDLTDYEHEGTKHKFRLYGTFNQLGTESMGMFSVEEIMML